MAGGFNTTAVKNYVDSVGKTVFQKGLYLILWPTPKSQLKYTNR